MKISLNWLKDHINLDGITAEQIAHELNMAGIEVEDMTDYSEKFRNFVVGYVEETEKHPNADKLTVCKVNTGGEISQIICGAPNVAAGQKVPVALPGAVVPSNGMEIKQAKLRGVVSNGVICSEAELDISKDHSGILVLPDHYEAGKPLAEAMGINDIVFEVSITPNRPDALSHVGIARELGAIFGREICMPLTDHEVSGTAINAVASVEIKDAVNCPRYSALAVLGCEVKDSPDWLKMRLKAVGLRPINNIVDITNYVLYELGQPLHAFDLDTLEGSKIIVKKAAAGEEFVTLDSQKRKLNSDILMICDGAKPVAVAGIMGGENSEVTSSTKNILIESAFFNPSNIRKSARFLGLNTDASYRFERGADYGNTVNAAKLAAKMMAELAGGKIADGIIDVYPKPFEKRVITLRKSRITRILGYHIPDETAEGILKRLGMTIESDDSAAGEWKIGVPSCRHDIEREIDLIEELARIYSYDRIPEFDSITIKLNSRPDEQAFTDLMRKEAISLGFNEILTNSFIPSETAALFDEPVKVMNPLTSDMDVLRTSLIPGALAVIRNNMNTGTRDLQLFETGTVFSMAGDEIKSFENISEREKLLIVLTGSKTGKTWYSEEKKFGFYDLKGYADTILSKKVLDYSLNDFYYATSNNIFDINFTISIKNKLLCRGGKVKEEVAAIYGIEQDVFCAEFDLANMCELGNSASRFRQLLKYPKIVRDCAFVVDKAVKYSDIENFIFKQSAGLLKKVELFDIYESESLGSDKRSLAFSLEYYDYNRTLTEEETEKEFFGIIEKVKKEFNAVLRGN
ncbi:MAG: phenylalanine--tRNA ligase subunit beta [Ignavibacteriaceae bacterium]|nr:phenylalanine--tRNA ligase subunit beta [Ignavibacteriaceae bacterium]